MSFFILAGVPETYSYCAKAARAAFAQSVAAGLIAGKQLVGGGDQADVGMARAVFAQFLGIVDERIGVDDWWIVLVFVVSVEPGQDDPDRFLVGGLKFFAGPG